MCDSTVPDLDFPFKRKVLPGSTLNGVLLLDAECYCYWCPQGVLSPCLVCVCVVASAEQPVG